MNINYKEHEGFLAPTTILVKSMSLSFHFDNASVQCRRIAGYSITLESA